MWHWHGIGLGVVAVTFDNLEIKQAFQSILNVGIIIVNQLIQREKTIVLNKYKGSINLGFLFCKIQPEGVGHHVWQKCPHYHGLIVDVIIDILIKNANSNEFDMV